MGKMSKMRKWVWCMFFLGAVVLEPAAAAGGADKPIALDTAIVDAHVKIESELEQGTRILVLNFTAPERLSDYVLDQLIAKLVNNKKLIVVERKDIALINEEMAFQLSGEVSDESAQAIGRKFGAQSITSGKFVELGDRQYQFSIKTINVETAAIEVFYQTFIKQDKKLDTLLGITAQQKAAKKEEAEREKTAKKEEAERQKTTKQNTQAAKQQQAAARKTKLILGVRGGVGGISAMGNQAADEILGDEAEAASLFPEEVYSVYFGTNSLNSLMGFQVEGNLYRNTGISVKTDDDDDKTEYSYDALDIPLLLRLGVGGGGMFSLFAGPYVSIPLSKLKVGNTEYKVAPVFGSIGSYGVLGGISMGLKLGPGYISLDGRYTYDFNEISITTDDDDDDEHPIFRRQGFKITLGYELWL
jgi:hypothetical protein